MRDYKFGVGERKEGSTGEIDRLFIGLYLKTEAAAKATWGYINQAKTGNFCHDSKFSLYSVGCQAKFMMVSIKVGEVARRRPRNSSESNSALVIGEKQFKR